jgi:hypothetical protein
VARALEEKHRLVSEYYQIPFLEAQEPTENNSAVATIAAAATAVSSSGNESEDADANRDAREVLLAALVQVKSLSDLVNESLTLSEEDAVAVASTSRLSPAAVATAVTTPSAAGAAGQPASEKVPSLSSLASEAVEELPSVKLYKRLHPPTHKLIAITKNMNQHLTSLLEIIADRDEERERLRKELSRAQDQVHTLLSQSSVRTSSLSVTSPASRPASFISIEESSGPETSERNQESEDDGASITTPTTKKSDTDNTSITIPIQIEVEKSDKPLNGEEVTLPTPEPSSPNETSEPESKSTVIDTDETTKNSDDEEDEEADKTIDDNTEDDSAV